MTIEHIGLNHLSDAGKSGCKIDSKDGKDGKEGKDDGCVMDEYDYSDRLL